MCGRLVCVLNVNYSKQVVPGCLLPRSTLLANCYENKWFYTIIVSANTMYLLHVQQCMCRAIRDCFRVDDIVLNLTLPLQQTTFIIIQNNPGCIFRTGGFGLSTSYYHQSCYEESATLCTLPEGAPHSQSPTHTLTSPATSSYTQHPRQTA